MPPRRSAMANDDITVHVEWLAQRLTQQQEDAAATEQHRITMSTHRVSRVPSRLKRDAYTPGLVAIGPLHAGESSERGRLRPGHRLKMAYLNSLISRGHPDPATHLGVIKDYIGVVAPREREARAMYAAEDVDDIRAEDFIQMMVLDGCFIIEHLVNVAIGHEEPSLHATPFGPTQLSVDLVLAENQIPFFVLVDLIEKTELPAELASMGYAKPVLLMKLMLYYLAGEKGRDMSDVGLPSADGVSHILHLLHATVTAARTRWVPPPRMVQDGSLVGAAKEASRLLRRLPLLLLVPLLYPILPEERRWSASYGREDLPSASDLKRMWVRFKGVRRSSKSASGIASVLGPVPLAVKLEHEDCLRLPRLKIEPRTAPLLLNLIAFEQSSSSSGQQQGWRAGDVSAYAWLMAKMVQSPEDAGVLVAAEVVQSSAAGSESKEDVARFFREVGAASEAAEGMEKSYLGDTLKKLRERSRHPLFMMWADVQRNYFTLPWAVVAEFVAFVTFISTILQTYGSFKQH